MWEFDDAVEVHSVSVDGVQTPDQFLWRGRLWRVRSVRSHWTETAAWWERGVIGTGHTHDPRAVRAADSLARIDAATVAEVCSAARSTRPTRTRAGVAAAADPRSRPAATLPSPSPAAVGVLDAEWGPERAVFRVEAGCGRYGRQEMFDLAHDPVSGRWQLERVTDR